MEGEKETVSVKWWNHRSALCRSIRDIYMKNLYADVKLVCDGHEYWVHKFVLSACSEYFETIMVDVPYQGSVKLAPSIRPKELLSLLDFMYLGIVDVLQQELPALVSAAEVLMIRGLAVPYEDDDSDEDADKKKDSDSTKSKTESQVQKGNSCKRKKTEDLESNIKIEKVKVEEETFEYCAESDLNPTTHSEPSTSNGGSVLLAKIPDQNCQVTSSNAEVNAMLKVLIGKTPRRGRKKQVKGTEELKPEKPEESPKSPDSFTCCTCMKTFQWRSNLTKHMRTHTGEKPYSCNVCSYRTSYSEALKRHTRIHTGEKPYQCEYCDYKSRDHGSLKVHLKRHSFSSCNQLESDDGQKDSNLASVNASLDLNLAPENDSSQDSNLVINESVSSSDLTVQDAVRVSKSGGNENANDSLLNFENII